MCGPTRKPMARRQTTGCRCLAEAPSRGNRVAASTTCTISLPRSPTLIFTTPRYVRQRWTMCASGWTRAWTACVWMRSTSVSMTVSCATTHPNPSSSAWVGGSVRPNRTPSGTTTTTTRSWRTWPFSANCARGWMAIRTWRHWVRSLGGFAGDDGRAHRPRSPAHGLQLRAADRGFQGGLHPRHGAPTPSTNDAGLAVLGDLRSRRGARAQPLGQWRRIGATGQSVQGGGLFVARLGVYLPGRGTGLDRGGRTL